MFSVEFIFTRRLGLVHQSVSLSICLYIRLYVLPSIYLSPICLCPEKFSPERRYEFDPRYDVKDSIVLTLLVYLN